MKKRKSNITKRIMKVGCGTKPHNLGLKTPIGWTPMLKSIITKRRPLPTRHTMPTMTHNKQMHITSSTMTLVMLHRTMLTLPHNTLPHRIQEQQEEEGLPITVLHLDSNNNSNKAP